MLLRNDFKPLSEEMRFREQTVNITQNMTSLSGVYLEGKKNYFDKLKADGMSKQDIIDRLNRAFDYVDSITASSDPSHLYDRIKISAAPLTKRRIFCLLTDHITHHCGQLAVYMRLNGFKPPEYAGW